MLIIVGTPKVKFFFFLVGVMGIFNWPITKIKNNQALESSKINIL